MEKIITLYTQPSCPPCTITKQFLDHHHIAYYEKDISVDTDARDKLVNELNSSTTPTVTIDSSVIIGFDLQKLEKVLGI